MHKMIEDKKLALTIFSEDVSDEVLIAAREAMVRHPQWKPGFNEIVDIRKATSEHVTAKGLRHLMAIVRKHVKVNFKTAIVAPDLLSYGMSRTYEAITAESFEEVAVFKTMEEACEWIGIDKGCVE
ncbi:MAG: hypothetical protein JW938_00405 [Candidatus Omnitrophica bacterium]|nr:hypothetical protein [Candidatus Omnitrophota bacterium]